MSQLPRYEYTKPYDWNFENAPDPVDIDVPSIGGEWRFCGLKVDSPLGMPAGPLLNGKWCLYYASLGFDVLTYKTVRSKERACYPLPNLQPVQCGQLDPSENSLPAIETMNGSWAVSFGMPSKAPDHWRKDVEETRAKLPPGKLLSVSVVGTMQEGWSIDDLAEDYAKCARWAVESGADTVETNFSCPNVSTCDGQLYQNPADAGRVAARVRQAIGNETPLIIKIGHETSQENASALVQSVAPYVSAVATTNCVAVTVANPDGNLLFDGNRRGICGEGIREATLDQTRLLSKAIQENGPEMSLISVGGITTAADVKNYLAEGASAVHIATAAMLNPRWAVEVKKALG